MSEKVKKMGYEEAWKRIHADYLVTLGVMYKYLKDKYGEETLVNFLQGDLQNSMRMAYFKGLGATLVTVLEKLAPEEAFRKKMREVAYRFQWFLGVGNIEISEFGSKKAVAELKYCPYAEALTIEPKEIGLRKDFYCKYQCEVFMKGFCKEVLGVEISFEPKGKGCVYRCQRI